MVTATLAQLQKRARQLADQEEDEFIDDEELTFLVNEAAQELLSLSADAFGEGIAVQTPIISVAEQEEYSLPADTFRVQSIEYLNVPMRRFTYADVEEMRAETNTCTCPRWRQEAGLKLRIFKPIKVSGSPLRLWYIKNFATLAAPADSLVVVPHGDTFIAATVAMHMQAKEESENAFTLAKRQEAENRIRAEGDRIRPPKRMRNVRNHRCLQ